MYGRWTNVVGDLAAVSVMRMTYRCLHANMGRFHLISHIKHSCPGYNKLVAYDDDDYVPSRATSTIN